MLTLFCMLAAVAAGETVYTQASSLNLRAEPNAKAKLVAEIRIGTGCTVAETTGDWVKLKCPTATGYAKAEMVDKQPPNYDQLRKVSRDGSKPMKDRVNAAQRLLALSPGEQ